MPLENQWVNYVTRSYTDIKNSVLSRITNVAPEITDHSESNVLVVIISIFAGIAEMLGYYIDNMARETFIATARRFSSGVKLAVMFNYRVRSSIMSFVDLQLTFNGTASSDYTLTKGKVFQTDNGVQFVLDVDVEILNGDTEALLPCRQGEARYSIDLGTTTNAPDQVYLLPDDYADSTCNLTIDGIIWERVETLAFSTNIDKHFIVQVSIDKTPFVQFGDGINGEIPPAGYTVLADFFITKGALGNVDPDTITTIVSTLAIPGVIETGMEVTNPSASTGGTDVESIASLKKRIPYSIRTLDRAVTRQDFVDIALLAEGVSKAAVLFDCGKTVDIYISPETGGIAPQSLLLNTYDFIYPRRMVTTFINVVPAGESYLILDLDVTLKFRVDPILGEQAIRNALLDSYGFDNSDINRPIRISDIYALVDNLEEVDFLTMNRLTTRPYARPTEQATPALNWVVEVNETNNTNDEWVLDYFGGGVDFKLYKNNSFVADIPLNTQYTTPNGEITLEIDTQVPAYTAGDRWEFVTYPVDPEQDINFDDYTVPVLLNADLALTINEQVTNN